MKKIFFLFLVFPLLFSSYINPPFNETQDHNNVILANISERYLNLANKNQTSFEDPIAFAKGELLLLSPSVDNRISADNLTTLLWVWAEEHEKQIWEKDAEDGCNDKLVFSDFALIGTISFMFQNITKNMSIDKNTPFNISVPFSQEELNKTSGTDALLTNLSGQFVFSYVHEIRKCVGFPICGCAKIDEEEVEFVKSFSSELNYTVEGGSVLFFLTTPLLREQWFRNNHFDNIVFSKRLFYKGDIKLNNVEIASFSFYMFNITEDKYELWRILSIQNYSSINMTSEEYNATITPTPLEQENETFIYLNMFNTSYNGIGINNLTLVLTDHFLNSVEKKSEIASRVISYNQNNSEDNAIHSNNEMRESALANIYNLLLEPFSLSLLGILLISFLAFNKLIKK